jgi:hypothetical protein
MYDKKTQVNPMKTQRKDRTMKETIGNEISVTLASGNRFKNRLRKSILSAVLAVIVVFTMFPMAVYADSQIDSATLGATEAPTITAPETQYDAYLIGSSALTRSTRVPTNYWNLASQSYSADLQQVTNVGRLYTNYYFYSNSNSSSKIYVDYSVSASGGSSNMTIGCYDITTGGVAATYLVSSIGTTSFKTGSMYFYGLNTSHKYAVYFQASANNVSVHGSATIKH